MNLIEAKNWFQRSIYRTKSKILFHYLPPIVDWSVNIMNSQARQKILAADVRRILVDNTIHAHAVTHETARINTGTQYFGPHPFESFYTARIPVHDENDTSKATRSVRYLPAIASLARKKTLTLCTSSELEDEKWTNPIGRFTGYGIYDYSLLKDVEFERIVDPTYTMAIGFGYPILEEQRAKRLSERTSNVYRGLANALGPKNTQDACHISVAEENGCYCFLTMDFALLENLNAQRGHRALRSLRTRIMSPEQFGLEFGLCPVSPRLYSYHGASFAVEHEANWPNSQRQKRRRKR
jgi:hypothetical protein